MNEKVKTAWLAALRSNKYTKAYHVLSKIENGKQTFCALGVLCDLHAQETGHEWKIDSRHNKYLKAGWFPPTEVLVWAGLQENDPKFASHKTTICKINDDTKTLEPFSRIADLIEKNL